MRFALPATVCLALAACTGVTMPPRTDMGVQLYTVRADMERDAIATLRHVARLGFGEVEFAGTYGNPPEALCAETRRLDLGVAAAHADWAQLKSDPEAAIAGAKALCADTIILAWLPPEERRSRADWDAWIGRLNGINRMAKAQGLALAYHAHDFEFRAIEGSRPIDLLMAGLDPRIGFELDTYWVLRGGEDPVAFYRAHRDRITHFHLKDAASDGSMADIGAGTIDFAALVREVGESETHWLVERDDAPDPWASLAASIARMRGVLAARR